MAKSSTKRGVFYLRFLFRPNRTKNKEMRAKIKIRIILNKTIESLLFSREGSGVSLVNFGPNFRLCLLCTF
jgi:hypothetical protein